MIAVIQRVKSASVTADGVHAGKIGQGLYILLGVEVPDTERDADLLAQKIAKLRIFSDSEGKMNLSVLDIGGEVLTVSNFTLGANYSHGNRPDYFASAKPEVAEKLYDYFKTKIATLVRHAESGVFGADMQSQLETDGPVTIVMYSSVLGGNGTRPVREEESV